MFIINQNEVNNNVVTNNTINNTPVKKKKYWLIPVCDGIVGLVSLIINIIVVVIRAGGSDINILLRILGLIAPFALGMSFLLFIPSIILAVVLQKK